MGAGKMISIQTILSQSCVIAPNGHHELTRLNLALKMARRELRKALSSQTQAIAKRKTNG